MNEDERTSPEVPAAEPGQQPVESPQYRVSDDAISVIAAMAATEVDGVAGMAGGLVGGLSEMLGKRNLAKGVKVEVGTREVAVDLYLNVEYGVRIPTVAYAVQENVKRAIENMTGLAVVEVNIHIQGVSFGRDDAESEVRVH